MTDRNEDRGEGERLSDRVTDEGSPYAIRSGGDGDADADDGAGGGDPGGAGIPPEGSKFEGFDIETSELIYIDPKGDDPRELIEKLPEDRLDDVVGVDPKEFDGTDDAIEDIEEGDVVFTDPEQDTFIKLMNVHGGDDDEDEDEDGDFEPVVDEADVITDPGQPSDWLHSPDEDVEEGDLVFPEPRNVSHIEPMNGCDDDESEDGVAAADWEWDDDAPAHDHAEHDHAELEPIDELDAIVREPVITAATAELNALSATKEAKRLLHVALRNGATQIETPRSKVVRLTDPDDGTACWKVYRIDYEANERAVGGSETVWTEVEKIPEDDICPGDVTGAVPVSPGRLAFPFGPSRSLDGLRTDLEAHRDKFRYGRVEAGSEEWREGVAAGAGYAILQLEGTIDFANEAAASRYRGLFDTDTNTDR